MTFEDLCERIPRCQEFSAKQISRIKELLENRNKHLDSKEGVYFGAVSSDLRGKLYVWVSLLGGTRNELDLIDEVI